MPKEEWGTKRVCPTTGRRFYDLGRTPIVSPYTGEVVNLETGKPARGAIASKAEKAKVEDAEVIEDDEEDVVLEDDDDADVDLGDDVLEEDEDSDDVSLDDIAEVASDDDD